MNETASTRIHNWSATRHCRTRCEVEGKFRIRPTVSSKHRCYQVGQSSASIQIRSIIATVESNVRPDDAMAI